MTDEEEKTHVAGFKTRDGVSEDFDDWEEFLKWANLEFIKWTTLDEALKNFGKITRNPIVRLLDFYSDLRDTAQAAIPGNEQSNHVREQAREKIPPLLDQISQMNMPVSSSANGQLIFSRIEDQPDLACAIFLVEHTDGILEIVSSREISAFVDAKLLVSGIEVSVEKERTALAKLQSEWAEEFRSAYEGYVVARTALGLEVEEKIVSAQAIIDAVSTELREANTAQTDARTAHEKEMERIRETYESFLTLKEPAEYWSKKAEAHWEKSNKAFKGLCGVAAGIIIGALLAPTVLAQFQELGATVVPVTVSAGLAALSAFWVMRAVGRIFTANLQLAHDAELRSTMVTTFLALMQDEKADIAPEDRILILQALFRPASAEGQDDGPAHSWADFLLRYLDKSKS